MYINILPKITKFNIANYYFDYKESIISSQSWVWQCLYVHYVLIYSTYQKWRAPENIDGIENKKISF